MGWIMAVHTCKQEAIRELKNGMSKADVAKKYNIPISTVCLWYDLEKEMHPEDFVKLSNKKFSRTKINETEARIVSLILPFVEESISDSEWIRLQQKINSELAKMVE